MSELINEYVGLMIKSARRSAKLTIKELAERLDIDTEILIKYEEGSERQPSSIVVKISIETGKDIEYFFPEVNDTKDRDVFIGERIKRARTESAHYNEPQVFVEFLEITVEQLDRFERGLDPVPETLLGRITLLTGKDMKFFTR